MPYIGMSEGRLAWVCCEVQRAFEGLYRPGNLTPQIYHLSVIPNSTAHCRIVRRQISYRGIPARTVDDAKTAAVRFFVECNYCRKRDPHGQLARCCVDARKQVKIYITRAGFSRCKSFEWLLRFIDKEPMYEVFYRNERELLAKWAIWHEWRSYKWGK